MIACTSCWCQNDAGAKVCWNCRASLSSPATKPPKAPKRVVEAPPAPSAEERLASAFLCPKGCSAAPKSKRSAAAGTGLARVVEIHERRFAAVSCSRCGLTELYDLELIPEPDRAGPGIDPRLGDGSGGSGA